ncbi:MAG: serine O-acetyltransferase [Planktothrix sp. GU0601_MAG3]|nr:MAG: serine O-acetyltransferase [Planktothrix sp. GU0601_MAG3]
MLEVYQADIDRYVITQGGSWIYLVLTKQGLWALAEYRFSHWVRTKVQIPIIKQILKTLGFIWHKIIEMIAGIDIPSKTQIGQGFYIGHFGGIIINQDVKIGENCNISQGVTIGVGGRGEKSGCPVIGDRVFIGPGAKIFGKIKIGNDVAIGANAVVTKDLPDNAVAVGIPARVVNYQGSKDFILYRDSIRGIETPGVEEGLLR